MPTTPQDQAQRPLALAVDIGTSSARAIIYDARGFSLDGSECQIGYEITTSAEGEASVDADELFELVLNVIDGALAQASDAGQIAVVGVAGFWHSLVAVDEGGSALTPVLLWADTRSRADVAQLRTELDRREIWRRTGCYLHSSYWPAKLRWLQRTQPDVLGKAQGLYAFTDLLLGRLLGHGATTISMASGTGLLDQRRARWDGRLVEKLGIDRELLPFIDTRLTPLTGLFDEYRTRWPALADAAWVGGIGDGAAANIGSGGIGPDRVALTVGTSGAMRMAIDYAPRTSLKTPDVLWTYRLDRKRAIVGAAVSNGGNVPAWVADLTAADHGDEAFAAAEAMEPDSHGLTMLPFLTGERAPIWDDDAVGTVTGVRLSTGAPELIRAGMEAVAYRFRLMYDGLKPVASADHAIIANGGAILRSPAWLQVMADVLEHPVVALDPQAESTARGAAVLALEAAGLIESVESLRQPIEDGTVIEPIAENVERYRAGRARQGALERSLGPFGRDSARS